VAIQDRENLGAHRGVNRRRIGLAQQPLPDRSCSQHQHRDPSQYPASHLPFLLLTLAARPDNRKDAAESLAKGSRVVVVGRLKQRSWTAEDGSARSTVEIVAEELGASLRWATATPARATKRGA
jgi:hypothetical protein